MILLTRTDITDIYNEQIRQTEKLTIQRKTEKISIRFDTFRMMKSNNGSLTPLMRP